MTHFEREEYVKILRARPSWFGSDNTDLKLTTLEKFRERATPTDIFSIIPLLNNESDRIKLRTAEVVIELFSRLKSSSLLYESLRLLPITKNDIDYYLKDFSKEIAVRLIALASLNSNGYVREKAVKYLADMQDPYAIRFILFRLGDWVAQVRGAALFSLQKYFSENYRHVFIGELPMIQMIQRVQRVQLLGEYNMILRFITAQRLNEKFYKSLKVSEKARLLYLRSYFLMNGFETKHTNILMDDRNFLVRLEMLNHLDQLPDTDRKYCLIKLLNDSSAQVRLRTLYQIEKSKDEFRSVVLELTSDESASVRDLARYLLQMAVEDLRTLYKSQIANNQRIVGSILGLAEVGSENDVEIFKSFVSNNNLRTKLAGLKAIHRFNKSLSRSYCLDLLTHHSKKIRNRCVDILAELWNLDVSEKCWSVYKEGTIPLRKTILTLFNRVAGWDALPPLILAVSDNDESIRNFAWMSIEAWYQKAFKLFTAFPQLEKQRFIQYYNQTDFRNLPDSRKQLWIELKYYLNA